MLASPYLQSPKTQIFIAYPRFNMNVLFYLAVIAIFFVDWLLHIINLNFKEITQLYDHFYKNFFPK